MANIFPTFVDVSFQGDASSLLVTWSNINSDTGDVCVPIKKPQYTRKSVHVYGTFGGGTVVINGSNNDGASYIGLKNSGVAISIASEGIEEITQNTELVQPAYSGGTAGLISITMLCVMPNPMRT